MASERPPLTEAVREEARQLMARYPKPRSALLPMLHLVQSVQGYVSPDGIGMCAELLGLTKAEVGAVATLSAGPSKRLSLNDDAGCGGRPA